MWNREQLEKLSREEVIALTEARDLIPATAVGLKGLDKDIQALTRLIEQQGEMLGGLAREEHELEANGPFLQAREALRMLQHQREEALRRREIAGLYSEPQEGGCVVWGSTFRLRYGTRSDDEVAIAALFGPLEREHHRDINPLIPVEFISCLSPIGLALWRARPQSGEVVAYEVEGQAMQCQVLEIIQDYRAVLRPPAALPTPPV